MDDQKDIQKDDPISRFFDGHIIRTNPFGDNRSGDRAYRRGERVVAAIYLITNHMAPGEPLRPAIRSGALALLENVLAVRDEMRSPDSPAATAGRASIRRIISHVRMLAVGGFVSIHNAEMVIEALDELGNFLKASERSPLSESVALTREAFMDARTVRESGQRTIKDTSYKGQKDNVSITDTSDMSVRMTDTTVSGRKAIILDILQAGRELGVRDIAAHLPEYSEKTIQRELSQLILLGRVKKNGFKRWSKYSRAA